MPISVTPWNARNFSVYIALIPRTDSVPGGQHQKKRSTRALTEAIMKKLTLTTSHQNERLRRNRGVDTFIYDDIHLRSKTDNIETLVILSNPSSHLPEFVHKRPCFLRTSDMSVSETALRNIKGRYNLYYDTNASYCC